MKESNDPNNVHLSINLKWVTIALVAIIVVMFALWQPWNSQKSSDRTVSVTGTATIKAEPDEFIFNPTYEIKNSNQAAALAEMTAKSNEVIAGLKKLGVASKDIKNNSSSYDDPRYPVGEKVDLAPDQGNRTVQLSLTVTVSKRELTQKVQDYLLTTAPSGQITPRGDFSKAKKKELEDKARNDASKDARTKAVKSAGILGYHLAGVKSVVDGAGFGGPIPYGADALGKGTVSTSSLDLQPGENEINYSVTVVYFVR